MTSTSEADDDFAINSGTEQQATPKASGKFKFSLRDLLFVLVIVAILFGWWVDHNRLPTYDVTGPLIVQYNVLASSQTAYNQRQQTIDDVIGITFIGDGIVVYTESGARIIGGQLVNNITWQKK